jgi:3-phenylpropionate/trans-cinnamate dioxygenase ferredoxin subunit
MSWTRIAASEEVGKVPCVFEHGGVRIAICRAGGALHAFEDRCTHDGGPLAGGPLAGSSIECPRHGARFDVRTGRVLRLPAAAPIRVYPVEEREGGVWVDLGEEA